MTTAIDAALEEAFREEPEPEHVAKECGYCGQPCEGRWCSAACRKADAYDGSHEEER